MEMLFILIVILGIPAYFVGRWASLPARSGLAKVLIFLAVLLIGDPLGVVAYTIGFVVARANGPTEPMTGTPAS